MTQIALTYKIDGDTGSHLVASRDEAHGILISKLYEQLPDLEPLNLLAQPSTDEDLQQVLEDAGLSDKVSFKTQIFVGP